MNPDRPFRSRGFGTALDMGDTMMDLFGNMNGVIKPLEVEHWYKCADCGKRFFVLLPFSVKCPKCGSSYVVEDRPWWKDVVVH